MAVDVMETETVVAVVGLKGSTGQGGEDPGGRGTEIGDLWMSNVKDRQTWKLLTFFPIILDMAVVVQCGQEPMKVGRFSGFSDKVCLFWSAFKGNKAWHPVPTRSSLVWNV